MRLGVCSACLPELTPHQATEAAAAAGYAGIEWRVAAETGSPGPAHFLRNNRCTLRPRRDDIRRARELCDRVGLVVVGLSGYVQVGDLRGVEQLMTLAAEAGAPRIRLWAPPTTEGGFHQALGQAIAFFGEVAELAGRFGVLDVPAILRLLDSSGYRGWVSVEDFSTDRPPHEALAFNAAYLRGHATFEPATGERA